MLKLIRRTPSGKVLNSISTSHTKNFALRISFITLLKDFTIKPIIIFLFLLVLGAGGYYGYKNFKSEAPQSVTAAPAIIDLVTSITNLSDEQADEGLKERASAAIKAHKQNLNPDLGSYKGLYSKCFIEDHDIHWIDESGTITKHVKINSTLTGNDNIARQMIYESGAGFIVVIYQNGYEAYGMDAKLVKSSH